MSWSFVRKIPKTIIDLLYSVFEVSEDGNTGIAIFDQDQTTDILDIYFLQSKAVGLTLDTDTVNDSREITLTAGHGLTSANSAGHILEIASSSTPRFYVGRIVGVSGDTVELAPPVDAMFEAYDSVVSTGNPNMVQDEATGAVIDGSATPVVFTVRPTQSQSGDINRVIMASTTENDGDLSTFAGAPALDLGILLRKKREDGSYKNIFTFMNNFDFKIYGFDFSSDLPKVVSNNTQGFSARFTFNGKDKHGVVVRLDGSKGEELQILVSERMDNTNNGNLSMTFLAQGSEIQN